MHDNNSEKVTDKNIEQYGVKCFNRTLIKFTQREQENRKPNEYSNIK